MKVGKLVSRGLFREVFDHPSNPEWVIKRELKFKDKREVVQELERKYGRCNLIEAWVWENISSRGRGFLVPTFQVSEDGEFLVMGKGIRLITGHFLLENEGLKRRREDFCPRYKDLDVETRHNWVEYNGELRVCDYGDHGFINHINELK